MSVEGQQEMTIVETLPEQGFRLSPHQRRLWRLQNGEPAPAYRCRCAFRLEGDLDRAALAEAFREVTDRHEILRTSFSVPPGMSLPVQVVEESRPSRLEETDLSPLEPEERERLLEEMFASMPSGWTLEARLFRLGAREHELWLGLPAMAGDLRTLENLAAEIHRDYARLLGRPEEEETEPPLQFADIAEWQNHLLESSETVDAVRRWTEDWREREIPAQLSWLLPFEEVSGAGEELEPASLPVPLAEDLARAVGRLLEAWEAPAPVFFLSCWQVLLWRSTGRSDVLVGVYHHGRGYEELRTALGPFAHYLPVHARLRPETRFRDLLAAVREAVDDAGQRQEHFNWEHASGESDADAPGFFPVCFEAVEEPPSHDAAGLRRTLARREERVDRFKLSLACDGIDGEIRLVLRYDRRRFRRDAVECLADRLVAILGSVVSRPEATLEDLDVLGPRELRRVLAEFNGSPESLPGEEDCLHRRFEEQAERTPERPAVVYGGERLTYRELNLRANRLGHHLRDLGVGPETPVALCLERSAEAVVAILGILKAGGAYVPLDPAHPADRLRFILEDTGAPVLVTERRLAGSLPEIPSGVRVVPLEAEAEAIAGRPGANLPGGSLPGSLAYVIYTSGSTGRPKGVLIEHRSPLALLAGLEAAVLAPHVRERMEPLRASLNAPLIFDASVQQLLFLTAGHTLYVVPEEARADGRALIRFLAEEALDLFDCTPSQLRLLVEAGLLEEGAPTPEVFLVAGEAIDDSLWEVLGRAERTVFYNIYGPTECTVDATAHRIGPDGRPTIGRPLAGYEVYLLDGALRPVPIGAPGEICIGGAGLARGYAGRPVTTAERFVPHPFASRPGARLYRTGDLARHRPSGDLEFLGRLDHQVKVRGFRIELGEIESVLLSHPGVEEAAVVARRDGPGETRLVAYVRTSESAGVQGELYRFLAERLPVYMVPAAFVPVPSLPRLPNGKLDRQALPNPESLAAGLESGFEPPRDAVEEILAGVWAELLRLDRVGRRDDFFEKGGHSLLATQLVSRVREIFRVEVKVRTLFESPTLAGFAESLEAALRSESLVDALPLRSAPRDGSLPLSFSQQRLWLHHQIEPESPAYNIPAALRFSGSLSVAALRGSLAALAERHETLRTRFALRDGDPVQEIEPAVEAALPVVDLEGLPQELREAETARLAREEALRPFDLGRAPLFRTALLRLSGRDHVLLTTVHHIVSDGWSTGIFAREMGALYRAALSGQPADLPPLPIQYADFALWQRQTLSGPALAERLDFWRRSLAGLDPVLELPSDRSRPARRTPRGATLPFALEAPLAREIRELGRREGTTLFMTLLAAFFALLHRQTSKERLCMGTPVAGRDRGETEGLIGFFVDTLVVPADLSGEPSVREHLGRVRDFVLEARGTRSVPFERLVSELVPERSLAYTPIFQVLFAFQNAPVATLELPEVEVRGVDLPLQTTKFDLSLILWEEGERLGGGLEYSLDLFDRATVRRLADQMAALLSGAVADPGRRISELPLLSPAERHQLLAEWGGQGEEPAATETLHGRFEEQARRRPEAPAVTCGDVVLRYGELNRRANQLAHRLREFGVGPEHRVGLCLERSPELLVGILGILKAGGAYVPLDPHLPSERRASMIEDAGIRVVIGTEEVRPEALAAFPSEDLTPRVEGASLAYLIYTSGSTGRPKGALVSHGNVARLFDATRHGFDFGEGDVWTLFHSYAFDFSVWEIWGALFYGGRLVIVPYEVSRSPETFLDLLVRERVTVLSQTPSAFAQLARVDEERGGVPTDLRLVVFGGEALDVAGLAPWFARHGDARPRLVNMYGITETTVHVTYRPLRAEDSGERRSVIGGPIPDLGLYVLDRWLQPVPVGVPGELAVGGAGLARGYLDRPELTASRFVPDPVSGRPGARLYRSGDLGRFLPNGDLEYLGRIDQQVKIRGFRIEPGEIEAVLGSHPGVRECAVLAREDIPGTRRLVAYVTGDDLPEPGELRTFLSARLPDYMVPAAFVPLASLPLTANGKLDRRALPAPERTGSSDGEGGAAPSDPVEELLAGIWAEVLGLPRVGIHDDFFEAGGDSLVATRLVSRLREIFRIELPVRALFEAPTIAGLAERIAGARRDGEAVGAPPLLPAPRDGALPLSYAQQRLWLFDRISPGSPAYNLSAAVRLRGDLDVDSLAASLGEIVRRHESLRTTFALVGDDPVQVVAPFTGFNLPVVDLTRLGAEEMSRLAAENAARAFDLANGPLLRPLLLRGSADDHVLLVAMHHIVSDGWSTGVLVRELGALYQAFREDRPSPLSALAVQYADFARWQRQWLSGPVLAREVDHWRQRLEGLPARLDLPADRPRPAVRTTAGAWLPFALPGELTAALRVVARAEGATTFMLLLGAFEALLARLSGEEGFAVGTPIAGRNRLETEGLIGFFVNTLVLRADLAGDPGFRALLGRVRHETLEAYAHQDLPFEKLVEELSPERSLAHTPLFQVMFLLQNAARIGGDLELPGISATPFPVAGTVSRFDLTLTLAESAGSLSGTFEYSTELFDRTTIARMARQLETLLGALAADPGRRLSELPLLSEPERHQLEVEWNDAPPAVFPLDLGLHELFERQADRTPDAVAVECGSETLTYRELEGRSNRLAWRLRALGVGPEARVALCVDRTPRMLVGLLGILKAGGAYVPLDPEYPRERLELMLDDAGVTAVVLDSGLLKVPPGLQQIRLDEAESTEVPRDRLSLGIFPENLAYVIYTSGSTGRPKGVQIPHRAVVNFLGSLEERLTLRESDVLVAVTSLSFDIAGLELFLPLAVGARVVIASREVAQDGAKLAATLDGRGATVLQATPATWRLLVEAGWVPGEGLCGLCGGEALPRELAARLLSGNAPLWNVYGPTETTIWSAARRVTAGQGPVPIGEPLAATGLHVLDRWGQPAPVGVPGELGISGLGLARGYLGKPGQTAERFVPAPRGSAPGERWYRTGDLVRYRTDGSLEFLGRLDHQVKVRGFRIELGEIEAALESHPAVRQAVVHPTAGDGGQALTAYVVPADLRISEIRSFLADRLPPYMVPSAWIALDAFPLTPNGKVDRKALPRPESLDPVPAAEPAASWTPTQEVLAGIWSGVLGDRRVGLRDDFFEIGGHSLLGTRVISRVREAFGMELPLRTLFELPTVAGLAQRIDAEREAGRGHRSLPPLERVSREAELPLSFAQQRLWFLDRLEPGNPYHNLSGALRLSGRLDILALEEAIREIVRRHEVLRTTFREVEGRPVQVIAPSASLRLRVEDLSSLAEGQREEESRRRLLEEVRRPFDLASGPLFRVILLRLADEEHLAVFNLHHIAGDGWSFGVLTRELAVLYEAFLSGAPSPLPELAIQYADFADWQRRWLAGEELAERLAYWRGRLEGAPPALELPFDRRRPEVPTFQIASVPFASPFAAELRRLGRSQGATLFMTLLAAQQTLLGRWSGQDDVVVGSPIANRTRPELEPLIGFFVNTLALRADLSGDPSFRRLLVQVASTTWSAYDHQDLPFERLVEELQPERSLARTPLFQVLFVLQNAPGGPLALPGLTLEPVGLARAGSARFDLTLALVETADGLAGSWEYNPDVFDVSTARRLAGSFEVLLGGLAAAWDRPLSELPLLTDEERHQILVGWNEPGPGGTGPARRLHDLFREQVGKTPDAVAVIGGRERLTYRELGRRVAAWARFLRTSGVGPEVLVGVFLERSVEMLVGMLAILEAGGAYVPLDPRYPQERLAYLLEDSRATLLLTQESLLLRLPERLPRVVTLAGGAPSVAEEAGTRTGADPDNTAYVIYTSGSTGLPKGVVIRHRSAAALVSWALATFGPESLAGVLASTSICFDLSVFELFVPLSAGGTVILAENALALPDLPAAGEVTLLNTVPSAMAELVRLGAVPPSVRTVNLAGEPLLQDLAARVHELPGVSEVYNLYGPSEDTTYSTGCRVGRGAQPTIGRPLAKARAYLLDRSLEAVPVGVIGEICLGGAGLARGYLNRPDLTADRFLPDPFAALQGEPGARIYRTGDLGRRLPGGDLEFLGRRDHQVKIRGYRIELGEIEAALSSLSGVREAIVSVREDLPGGRGLVAWVVPEPGEVFSPGALREALRGQLPEALIPARFVPLDALPLTPNGKVDRQSLTRRPLDPEEAAGGAGSVPRTPTEELMAGLFAEVLRREEVGLGDSFFDLGGHSLLATQLLSRIRATFGLDLPLRVVFEHPTVGGLAGAVDAAGTGNLALPAIEPVPRTGGLLPLSFAQRRLWFLHRVEPDSPAYNLPAAVRLRGPLRIAALAAALDEIVRRHEVLRTTFPGTEIGEPVQAIHPGAPVSLPVVDLSAIPGSEEEALRLVAEEAGRPFDLARGPLFRSTLVALGESGHIALFTLHHIVSDGWSMGILVREIAALYQAFLCGERSPLPALPIQYADFAHWQLGWLEGRPLEALADYWTRSLTGAPPQLELPGARPRPPVQSGRGAVRERRLGADLARDLHALGRRESSTLFMTLLAAFQALLHARTGATDLVVGTDVAGRNRREIEPLIGFFVNQLALRTQLGGNPTFHELLARVREVALGAYAHQDLPFDRLVDLLKVPRSLAFSPVFQVKLVLQNVPEASLDLADLSLSPVGEGATTSQLDLNLRVSETPSGLHLSLQYSTDLYESAAMEWLLELFEEVLRAVVACPGSTLLELAEKVREADRSRWAEREREARNARHKKLQAIRRPGTPGGSS